VHFERGFGALAGACAIFPLRGGGGGIKKKHPLAIFEHFFSQICQDTSVYSQYRGSGRGYGDGSDN